MVGDDAESAFPRRWDAGMMGGSIVRRFVDTWRIYWQGIPLDFGE